MPPSNVLDSRKLNPARPAGPIARLVRFLRLLGPGIVFALTVLGAGDFVSNAATGAAHGYALLWVLPVALVFRFVWLDASARYVMATGESLMDGYARFGGWLTPALVAAMVAVRWLSNLYKLALLVDIGGLFLPLDSAAAKLVLGGVVSAAAWMLCDRGGYPALERVFKALVALMCGALIGVVVIARPDPGGVLRGLVQPALPESRGIYGTWFLLIALIGTEAGSVTNITYSYFLRRKGWRDGSFRGIQQRDLWLSVCSLLLASACVQIAAAGTLHPAGVSPKNAEDLVRTFSETLGSAGRLVFTFGLCAAAFSTLAGSTTGYAMILSDVAARRRGRVPAPEVERDAAYRLAVAFWCFTPLVPLAFQNRPVWLTLFASAVMGALIPLLGFYLLRLTSDKTGMGDLVNSRWVKVVFAALISASVLLVIGNGMEWVRGFVS